MLLSILASLTCAGQGIPYVSNFNKSDYSAAGRNWSVSSDTKGNIYTANSSGLLRFNGSEWKLYPVAGNRIVRSVHCQGDTVYVGSFEEFGYFVADACGRMCYTSLSALVRGFDFHNDEIWGIVSLGGRIYFRSFAGYFVYDGRNVEACPLANTLAYMEAVGGQMYAFLLDKGLYRLDGADMELLIPSDRIGRSAVTSILPYRNGRLLLFSAADGIFATAEGNRSCAAWSDGAGDKLREAVINKAVMTADSSYVVGTISDGIYALGRGGELLWRINAATGLANNTVLALCCDRMNNIWAMLDNGISYIRSNSDLTFLFSFRQQIGYVYSAALRNGAIYLATNQGLYYSPDMNSLPVQTPVKLIDGQSWDLFSDNNQLFCGNNEGTFEIAGAGARSVSGVKGGTCIRKGLIHGHEVLVQSTYTYLVIYRKDASGRWVFSNVVEGFMHPIRSIEIDAQGTIWAQHFYDGLYRIRLDDALTHAVDAVMLQPDAAGLQRRDSGVAPPREGRGTVSLMRIRGRIVFNAGDVFYTYDDITDSIKPFEYLNEQLSRLRTVRRVVAVSDNIYWLICPDKFVMARFDREGVRITEEIPFSSLYDNLPDNDENILVLPDGRHLMCMNNGVAVFDRRKPIFDPGFDRTLGMERIESSNNRKETRLLPLSPDYIPHVRHNFNTLSFYAAYPHYPGERVTFSFRLGGAGDGWSVPSPQAWREFPRLGKGQYTLQARAFDNLGVEIGRLDYSFTVGAPFYASNLAVVFYCLVALGIAVLAVFIVERYIARSKEKVLRTQMELREKEAERHEHRIMQLKNDKLELELNHKSRELAGSAMSIIRKNEMLVAIKEELTVQKEKLGAQYPNKYYDRLTAMIDSNLTSEDDWLVFQENFDRIHEHFFRNLKTAYPALTPNDLKFCALLRLNLNSKEIANILNITLKGVEIGRYRLRKKLGLASTVNLVDFMIRFK